MNMLNADLTVLKNISQRTGTGLTLHCKIKETGLELEIYPLQEMRYRVIGSSVLMQSLFSRIGFQ